MISHISMSIGERVSADVMTGSQPRRVKNENSVQIDFVNLDQYRGILCQAVFCRYIQTQFNLEKRFFWCNIIPSAQRNIITFETQPRAHEISSRKIGSGDRLGRTWLGLGGTDSIGVNRLISHLWSWL